ncbi:putative membrane protein YphA (DoxX/SURF4 family) [Flavobacterium sp. CG_23.5]|uniref:MauE/DoxX family redox-associated membrane protein n=1 Tax=Flavobacterium sp. CG_23.5 TaxID=2760708 RepID=UPI001AE16D73|nr:MauE/DoxX family redox-associated membrane protein [Flavobacterium sp. CG_23.5]MBP2283060.1 putative membrane protein YphA (DoxX/SURF4 family) [Flavobacterium sp. CG_23.5]
MKVTNNIRKNYIDIISYLFIILFSYASFSKLLDYESFTIQIGQSPLISAFAGWVSWSIPSLELLIAALLMFKNTKLPALVASFTLMVMFSAYIFIILHYSEFVPCSCGGILEKMTWNQHLTFNLIFCLLAAFAIVSSMQLRQQNKAWKPRCGLVLIATSLFAVGIVLVLFLKSEQIIHQENNFVRRYPPHLYSKLAQLNLKYDGNYFAGIANEVVYLGNYASPLSIVAIDKNLKVVGNYRIDLNNYDLPYRAALVRIRPPYFYLTDGTVPCIFRGKIADWKAKQIPDTKTYFSAFEPIDASAAVFRGKSPKTGESILGAMLFSNNKTKVLWGNGLLQKQIDGIFDCDGMLRYNSENQKLIYTYYYRNQFIVADKNMKDLYRGNTIDTTSFAKIKVATLSNGDRKMAEPPLMVNKLSSTSGNQLFVNSNLRGRFESLTLWKQTSVIDVYDLKNNVYDYSFYVYHLNEKKPQAMYAVKNRIYFLFEKTLVVYQIDKSVRR